jgi:UDP-glucose 4-epimerase
MINKILVTGSLGQLGSYLSEDFPKEDIDVIGLDNGVNKCPTVPVNVTKITKLGDICDEIIVNKILIDVDAVVHCAAQVSVEKSLINPKYDMENNVIGTLNLLQAAVKSQSVKRFVYISTAATYGNPIELPINENHPQNPLSAYGLSKLTGEKYVNMFWQIHRLPTVVIRLFNIYSKRADPQSPYSGVITKFIGRVKADKPPIIEGDGNQTRDFIHVNNVVQMIHLVLEKKEAIGEVFNCGSGTPVSINQLAEIITNSAGKTLKPIYTDERKGDIKHSYADITKAKKVLNFKPNVELEDGLKEIIIF